MISIKNLVKIYNKGKGNEYKALKGIDFQVQDGELVAVIGKSGAGKSTFSRCFCCMFWQELIALRAAVTTLETKMWDRCRKNNWRSFETKVLEWLCRILL